MFLFCGAKAKTASRGREIFPSGKIFVTTKNLEAFSVPSSLLLTANSISGDNWNIGVCQ